MRSLPEPAKPQWSLRSQANICQEWRLESELTKCQGNLRNWQEKLRKAAEGVKRQTAQVNAGNGYSHSILRSYVADCEEAKRMVASFEEHAADLQKQIEALKPDAAKAKERAQQQEAMAHLVGELLKSDADLSFQLELVRENLRRRRELTSDMRKLADLLEFPYHTDLQQDRFAALLAALPQGIVAATQKWVSAFLGSENDRTPFDIRTDRVTLPENLRSANAFRYGDRPSLTKEEREQIERESAASVQEPSDLTERFLNPKSEAAQESSGVLTRGIMFPR